MDSASMLWKNIQFAKILSVLSKENLCMSEKFLDPQNGTLTEIFLPTGAGGQVVKINFLREKWNGERPQYCNELYTILIYSTRAIALSY
jgi:hypothetical protein